LDRESTSIVITQHLKPIYCLIHIYKR